MRLHRIIFAAMIAFFAADIALCGWIYASREDARIATSGDYQ